MLPKESKLYAGYLSTDELTRLAPVLGFADSTVDACKTANSVFRSGVEIYENYTFTELTVVDPLHRGGIDVKKDDDAYVALYITRNGLIVVNIDDSDNLIHEKFMRAIKRFTPGTMTLEKLIYAFFDELLSKDVAFIEKLSMEVTEMEESILEGKPEEDMNITLLKLKRKLLKIRNYYEQCIDIFEVLEADETAAAEGEEAVVDAKKYIRRERYYGTCRRAFYVGEEVTQNDIKAKYDNGILQLFVPKIEPAKVEEEKKFINIEG